MKREDLATLDLSEMDHFGLRKLVVKAARELTTRENEMESKIIGVGVKENLSFAHEVLAAHHRANQISLTRPY